MRPASPPEPTWNVPNPYGYARALDSAGTFAAPLFAGFTVTLMAFVVSNPGRMLWPNLTLLALAIAAVFLFAAVQLAYVARQYVVSPAELEAWWPGLDDDEDRWKQVRQEQSRANDSFLLWAARFRLAYHTGVVVLGVAVSLILVPPGHISFTRVLAIVVAGLGCLGEVGWIAGNAAKMLEDAKLTRQQRRAAGQVTNAPPE
jgi:MFS family permease